MHFILNICIAWIHKRNLHWCVLSTFRLSRRSYSVNTLEYQNAQKCWVTAIMLLCYQARTEYLRRKARAALGDGREDGVEATGGDAALEHLNLFPLEESSEKKGNEEHLKEKKDEKVSNSNPALVHIYFYDIKENPLIRLITVVWHGLTFSHQL